MKPIVILGLIALAVIIIAEIAYIIRLNIKEKRRDSPSVRAWKNFISQAHLFKFNSIHEKNGEYCIMWTYGGYEIDLWVNVIDEKIIGTPVTSIHIKDYDYLHDTNGGCVLSSYPKESKELAQILLKRFYIENLGTILA